ncbi:hypothetical protein AAHC03_022621 [Spirometra sp. Aus1]
MVKKLSLTFHDALMPFGNSLPLSQVLQNAVVDGGFNQNMNSMVFELHGKVQEISVATPWFEAWRHAFISGLGTSEHEFLTRFLACIFVVSTKNADVPQAFATLVQQHVQLVQNQQSRAPRWFCQNVAKFYVLLNDLSCTSQSDADSIFRQVTATYGPANCYLLNLSSNQKVADTIDPNASNGSVASALPPDPWLAHLLPHGYSPPAKAILGQKTQENPKPLASPDPLDPLVKLPPPAVEGRPLSSIKSTSLLAPLLKPHGQCLSSQDHDKLRVFVEHFVTDCLIPWVESTMKTLNEATSHRLRKSRNIFSATRKFFAHATGSSAASAAPSITTSPSLAMLDGNSDLATGDRLVGSQSDSSFLKTAAAASAVSPNATPVGRKEVEARSNCVPTVVYTDEAPELQLRRLADLAFLFQLYETAHQIYDVLRRDFQNDAAWLHYAGVQEMSALSTYLQGSASQRQYPQHQMDEAINTYLYRCRNSELALRAVLLNTEALKSRDLFPETAVCFLRLSDGHDYMTGGLLLEQAAQCCLRFRKPALRHYAFRMTLAAMRYGRAKQPQLSARCYSLALNILKGSQWSLAEDHLNENFGKQALLLNDLPTALTSFRSLITLDSKQTAPKQSFYLTEFLGVMQKASLVCSDSGRNELPELHLPVIDRQRVKVMLGAPILSVEDSPVQARGIHFSDDEHDDEDDRRVFRKTSSSPFFPSRYSVAPNIPPRWMCSADHSDDEKDTSSPETTFDFNRVELSETPISKDPLVSLLYSRPDYRLASGAVYRRLEALLELHSQEGKPSCNPCLVCLNYSPPRPQNLPVGERLTVQVPLHNPWLIPLILTDVQLLWRATLPASASSSDIDLFSTAGQPKKLTNEANGEELRNARKFIATDSVSEFYMLAGDKKMIELGIQAKQVCTQVELLGLAFNLNVSSPNQQQYQQLSHHRSLSSVERFDGSTVHCNSSSSLLTSGLASMSPASSQNSLTSAAPHNGDKALPKFTMSPVDSDSDLSSVLSAQPTDPLVDQNSGTATPSLLNPLLPSTLMHNPVRGKLLFVSSASSSKASGKQEAERSGLKDVRFAWSIVPSLPLLSVSFDGFPQELFEGEIHSFRLTLTNSGLESLRNVRLISSWPGFFVFATKATQAGDTHSESRMELGAAKFIQQLPFLDGDLAPSACIEQPAWLRAPSLPARKRTGAASVVLPPGPPSTASQTGSAPLAAPQPPVSARFKQTHFVFSYSATQPSIAASAGPRYLRHETLLKLLPSLRLRATIRQTYGLNVSNLLLTLHCKNISKETTFSITQLTSCNRRWDIELVWPLAEEQVGLSVAPCQEVTICLRAKVSSTNMADCSSVSLCSTEAPPIDVTTSPISGFLQSCAATKSFRTPSEKAACVPVEGFTDGSINSTKANCTGEANSSQFMLVAFWKVVSSDKDSRSNRLGLSRICVPFEDGRPFEGVVEPPVQPPPPPLPPIQTAPDKRDLLSPLSTSATSLIRLRLHHPARISHCFVNRHQPCTPSSRISGTSSMAAVPVVAEVYNASSVPVLVRLEAADVDSRTSRLQIGPLHSSDSSAPPLRPGSDPYWGSVSLPSVLWAGLSLRHFRLEPAETRKLDLEARVCDVGVYDVMSGLRVSAAPARSEETAPNFVCQTCNYSSLLVVESTTTSFG